MTPKPLFKIVAIRAYGNEAEQVWKFLNFTGEEDLLSERWLIKRKYTGDGDVWWGVFCNWKDTHENGLANVAEEMKLAIKAIAYLKKNWKKHLSNNDN